MDNDQISLLVLYGAISWYSTKLKDEDQNCKELSVLVINALALIILSGYIKDTYFLGAFIISLCAQYTVQKERRIPPKDAKEMYVHYAILLAIYLLLGGFEQVMALRENFTDYASYGGVPLMVRNANAPYNPHYDKSKLEIANMDGNSQILRKSDPAYRAFQLQDDDDYDDGIEGKVVFDVTSDEAKVAQKIRNIYASYVYSLNTSILSGKCQYSVSGYFRLLTLLVVKDLDNQTITQFIQNIVLNPLKDDFKYKWQNRFNDHNQLYVFLKFIVEPMQTTRITKIVTQDLLKYDLQVGNGDARLENAIQMIMNKQQIGDLQGIDNVNGLQGINSKWANSLKKPVHVESFSAGDLDKVEEMYHLYGGELEQSLQDIAQVDKKQKQPGQDLINENLRFVSGSR